MYCSDNRSNFQLPPLFQERPKYGDDDHASWTESILSYGAAARHHAALLKLNQTCKPRSDYRYWATISLTKELPPKSICEQWKKIKRHLRKYLVAGWTAEIDPNTNRVHWHLIISHWPDFESTYLILQTLGPKLDFKIEADRLKPRFDCSLRKSIHNYIDYICKASDHHNPVLFRSYLGIQKANVIGPFWKKPKGTLDRYLKEKFFHRPNAGMKQPGAVELVNLLHDWLGDYMSWRDLRHKIGTASTCHWWSEVPRYDTFKRWREELSDQNFYQWDF